jgi:Fic-DOC domain mobile mystery protein B
MKFTYPEGATPIDADEASQLIPPHITLQRELNEWEATNILAAVTWTRSLRSREVLDPDILREVHHRMFDHTWQWAGTYRRSDKNIGVPWYRIPEDVLNLCEDAKLWIADGTYSPDETAVRFHHRLVLIHPFPNGNGRHARLVADVLAVRYGRPVFSWGRSSLSRQDETRRAYIQALQRADRGDITPLLEFARN